MTVLRRLAEKIAPRHRYARPKGSNRPYYQAPHLGLNGRKPISLRLTGLDDLFPYAEDAEVIDLGCAEGIVLNHLLQAMPRAAQGIDNSELRIELAREAHADSRLRFDVVDLNDAACFRQDALARSYDMMLMLSVYQHLLPAMRGHVLNRLLARCRRYFVFTGATPAVASEVLRIVESAGFVKHREISSAGRQMLLLFERQQFRAGD